MALPIDQRFRAGQRAGSLLVSFAATRQIRQAAWAGGFRRLLPFFPILPARRSERFSPTRTKSFHAVRGKYSLRAEMIAFLLQERSRFTSREL